MKCMAENLEEDERFDGDFESLQNETDELIARSRRNTINYDYCEGENEDAEGEDV